MNAAVTWLGMLTCSVIPPHGTVQAGYWLREPPAQSWMACSNPRPTTEVGSVNLPEYIFFLVSKVGMVVTTLEL